MINPNDKLRADYWMRTQGLELRQPEHFAHITTVFEDIIISEAKIRREKLVCKMLLRRELLVNFLRFIVAVIVSLAGLYGSLWVALVLLNGLVADVIVGIFGGWLCVCTLIIVWTTWWYGMVSYVDIRVRRVNGKRKIKYIKW